MTPAGFVYFLADPRTPRWPRYVGVTNNPVIRARNHAKRSTWGNPDARAWKASLRALGLAPRLIVIASFATREEAIAAEWRLINRWRRRGLADLNTGREGLAEMLDFYRTRNEDVIAVRRAIGLSDRPSSNLLSYGHLS